MAWNCSGDEDPEFRGMVEFAEVAQFMDDDVVGKFLGQERYFVIKI